MAIAKAAAKKGAVSKKTAAKKTPAKQAPVKRAAVKKSPAKKGASKRDAEFLVNKLVAIYWEQFGRGAVKPVDPGCFDRAVELGALANVRSNLVELSKFGTMFKGAETCSFRAGKRAGAQATKAKLKTITPDIYEEAFLWVARSNAQLSKRNGRAGKIEVEGFLC